MKAPKHLRAPTRRWWASVVAAFDCDEHHLKLLLLAAEALDRHEEARSALAEHGLVYEDRFGAPHMRPEAGIARDAAATFVRCLRELGLDAEMPIPKGYTGGDVTPIRPDVRRIHSDNAAKQAAYRARTGAT